LQIKCKGCGYWFDEDCLSEMGLPSEDEILEEEMTE